MNNLSFRWEYFITSHLNHFRFGAPFQLQLHKSSNADKQTLSWAIFKLSQISIWKIKDRICFCALIPKDLNQNTENDIETSTLRKHISVERDGVDFHPKLAMPFVTWEAFRYFQKHKRIHTQPVSSMFLHRRTRMGCIYWWCARKKSACLTCILIVFQWLRFGYAVIAGRVRTFAWTKETRMLKSQRNDSAFSAIGATLSPKNGPRLRERKSISNRHTFYPVSSFRLTWHQFSTS